MVESQVKICCCYRIKSHSSSTSKVYKSKNGFYLVQSLLKHHTLLAAFHSDMSVSCIMQVASLEGFMGKHCANVEAIFSMKSQSVLFPDMSSSVSVHFVSGLQPTYFTSPQASLIFPILLPRPDCQDCVNHPLTTNGFGQNQYLDRGKKKRNDQNRGHHGSKQLRKGNTVKSQTQTFHSGKTQNHDVPSYPVYKLNCSLISMCSQREGDSTS